MRSRIAQGFASVILGLCLTFAVASACLAQPCVGDCDGDGAVEINELITAVNIDLGAAPSSVCLVLACDCGAPLALLPPGICCMIAAVNNALNGCNQIA